MQLTTRSAACTGLGPIPRPAPAVLLSVRFGLPTPPGRGTLQNADSDLMLQWNPGPARKNSTQIQPAVCGRSHVVILQQASDHAPLVSDQFVTYTGGTDLAMLLNKNTFEPDAAVAVINESSTSKDTWERWPHWLFGDCYAAHLSRELLRSHSALSTFTMSWPEKRDASTSLLQALHAHVLQHNVHFIGGDFNVSAHSTVGHVSADQEFAPPSSSLLSGLRALTDTDQESTGFLIMPKRPYEWRVDSHGCYKFDNAQLGFGPRDDSAHLPVFLHLRSANIPGPSSVIRSPQAPRRRLERAADKQERQKRHKPQEVLTSCRTMRHQNLPSRKHVGSSRLLAAHLASTAFEHSSLLLLVSPPPLCR